MILRLGSQEFGWRRIWGSTVMILDSNWACFYISRLNTTIYIRRLHLSGIFTETAGFRADSISIGPNWLPPGQWLGGTGESPNVIQE